MNRTSRKHIWICLLAILILSCSKTYETTIPNWPVNLELDLTYTDNDLYPIGGYTIYTTANTNPLFARTGFGGVLVYHGVGSSGTGEYFAFDAACPYEANKGIRVEVDETGMYAVCPQCHSRFGELMNGIATPVSGPAQYALKPYSVWKNGNKIYVQN